MSLNAAEIYRLVYYIERICFYVTRSGKMNEWNLNEILRVVDAYDQFEESVGDRPVTASPCHRYETYPASI